MFKGLSVLLVEGIITETHNPQTTGLLTTDRLHQSGFKVMKTRI
jgi:hypothetical protein